MLIDTDVLIWYLKGNPKARTAIEGSDSVALSVVNYMELVQGMRNKNELAQLRKAMRAWDARILYLTEEISARALFLIEQHFLSHSLHMADALIAATAMTHGLTLLSANDKHYKFLKGLAVKKFRT